MTPLPHSHLHQPHLAGGPLAQLMLLFSLVLGMESSRALGKNSLPRLDGSRIFSPSLAPAPAPTPASEAQGFKPWVLSLLGCLDPVLLFSTARVYCYTNMTLLHTASSLPAAVKKPLSGLERWLRG